jgi:XapX domain-containing protein
VTEGDLKMKALLISFVVGLLVGVVYGVIRVKSPAPPIVALLGLLGMVLGEQAGGWLLTKKIQATNVASLYIVSEHKDQQQRSNAQSVTSSVHRRSANDFSFAMLYACFYRMLTGEPTCLTTARKPSRNCSRRC